MTLSVPNSLHKELLLWQGKGGAIRAWCEVPELRCAGVTAPQLALLETTMLKMERVDTWVLMMGGGSGVDVFLVGTIPAVRSSHSRVLHEG